MNSDLRIMTKEEEERISNKEQAKSDEDEDEEAAAKVDDSDHLCNDDEGEERPWSDLLPELVLSIAKQLPITDRLKAKYALPSWAPAISEAPFSWPFLLAMWRVPYFEMIALDPAEKTRYSLGAMELAHEVIIKSSKHCVLLLTNGPNRSTYFYNPFTRDRIDLPPVSTLYDGTFCFSGTPTCSPCAVLYEEFRGDSVRITYCCRGDESWRELFFPLEKHSFTYDDGNAVFHRGKVYRMGRKGRLGVFDPTAESWTVHDSPDEDTLDTWAEFNYLVESDDVLYRLWTDQQPVAPIVTSVRVYKYRLDDISGRNRWEETRSIGGRCFFVSYDPLCVETAAGGGEFGGDRDVIYFAGETYQVGSFFRFDVRRARMIYAESGPISGTFYQNSCWILPQLDHPSPGEERWF